jgi:Ca-activated chloride channel family protein
MSGVPLRRRSGSPRRRSARSARDTFNVIRFAGDNEVYSKDPLPNDRASVESAIAWLVRQQGGGGTELLAAMKAAFARPTDPNRLRVVVFLTDGYVGDEAEILSAIGPILGDARIYSVGIGSSVNHHPLDRMADLGRGAHVFVRYPTRAPTTPSSVSVVGDAPLSDGSVDRLGRAPRRRSHAERLPDLGSGQTLTVVGRYLSAGEGDVAVRGKIGGRYFEQSLHVALPERETRNEALSSLWARGRIEELLRVPVSPTPDSVTAEVTALALTYRLMSPYTSFVAVDDSQVVNASGTARTVHQALPLPEGCRSRGSFGNEGPAGLREATEGADVEETIVTAGAGAEFGRAQGGFAAVVAPNARPAEKATSTTFSADFVANPRRHGRTVRHRSGPE